MCWTTKKIRNRFPRIAIKDIRTFKICINNPEFGSCIFKDVNGNPISQSPVKFAFPLIHSDKAMYREGMTYTVSGIEKPLLPLKNRYKGYHSYDRQSCYVSKPTASLCVFNKKDRMIDSCGRTINLSFVECTIPRGSIFFRNENGHTVSNKLRIDKIHVLEDKIINKSRG